MDQIPTPEQAPKGRAAGPLKATIIAAMPPETELGDSQCPGLRVRCNVDGTIRTFFYRYRDAAGALRQIKLGNFGALTLAAARKEVEKKRVEREQGIDPQAEKQRKRKVAKGEREAKKQTQYTVTAMIEQYAIECLSKQKRGGESERLLNRELLPKLGARAAADVSRRELLELVIRPTMARAPRVATMLLSRIRCAYEYAAAQGRFPDDFNSPTLGIKGAAQVRRKRAFSDAELATFLKWLPNSSYSRTVRDALRLVLLTGCRSGEIVAALWRDIDIDRGVWNLRETKNGEPHDVMLSRQTIELLNYRAGINAKFVFPGVRGTRPVQQKALGLAQYVARKPGDDGKFEDPIEVGWTVHDLRRTVATGLAKLGCPRVVQDRILNHADSSIAAIYDRHRYDAEAREWLQRWADYLDALIVPNVTAINAARAV